MEKLLKLKQIIEFFKHLLWNTFLNSILSTIVFKL